MDSIQSVFDGYAFQVSRCHLEPQGEVQVDLLDRRCGEEFLQRFLVIQCCRRRVQLPSYELVLVACRRVTSTSGLCDAIDAIVRHDGSKGRHVPVQLLSLLCYLEFLSFLLCVKRQRVGHVGQTAGSLVSGSIAEPLTYPSH